MRTLVFGDVHGCLATLKNLVRAFDPQPGDRMVSVGDLVHKGPDSPGVVRFCRKNGVVLVKGNHELQQEGFRKALRVLQEKNPKWSLEKCASRVKVRDEAARIERWETERGLSKKDVAYLESAHLFALVPGGVAVHAGIMPTLESIPTPEEFAAMGRAEQEKVALCARVRYLRGKATSTVTLECLLDGDADNMTSEQILAQVREASVTRKRVQAQDSFVPMGRENVRSEDYFWATKYDGRFGWVYFGHEAVKGKVMFYPHAVGLDSGCVKGGDLSGIVLDEEGAQTLVISTPMAD